MRKQSNAEQGPPKCQGSRVFLVSAEFCADLDQILKRLSLSSSSAVSQAQIEPEMVKEFIVLQPRLQGAEHNVVRIHRKQAIEEADGVLHIAGGSHSGIVINKLNEHCDDIVPDVQLSFSVWLRDGDIRRQENRSLRFVFEEQTANNTKHAVAQQMFQELVTSFPKDYVTFMRSVLKMMQNGYESIDTVEIDMQLAAENEEMVMPDAKEYDSGSEVENVTIGHVQETLEHAFPCAIGVEVIAEALRCSVEVVEEFLLELEKSGIVRRVGEEWMRLDESANDVLNETTPASVPTSECTIKTESPTVAIITCLFVEKQIIDSMIENGRTVFRYRKGGDSNVYTIGTIEGHNVVATKLAVIGDTREANTSSGSITTRLLGNFRDIEHVIVVGVGGGVAHFTDSERHVRLGDVVVSAPEVNGEGSSAYVYAEGFTVDRTSEQINGFVTAKLDPKSHILTDIARKADMTFLNEWDLNTETTIHKLNSSAGYDESFVRPPPETDVLAVPVGGGNVVVVPHPNNDRTTSAIHIGPIGAMTSLRRPAGTDSTLETDNSETTWRNITAELRDRFAAENGLRAMDAGFKPVIDSVKGSCIDSWTLVRGIADYQHGQSRSAKVWQAYSAVRACAYVRTLLKHLPQ
uniref:PNP_UDP_1 domain-containing protein n=1 Tax=Steinernema glaseri TaxID=37863 RepID=A0A1I8ARL2_9BILA